MVSGGAIGGYHPGMAHSDESPQLEMFIGDVEVSIIDSVDSLNDEDAARLYAEVLNAEQRLDAFRDALSLLASTSS